MVIKLSKTFLLLVPLETFFFVTATFGFPSLFSDDTSMTVPSERPPRREVVRSLYIRDGAPLTILKGPKSFKRLNQITLATTEQNEIWISEIAENYPGILSLTIRQKKPFGESGLTLLKQLPHLQSLVIDCPLEISQLDFSRLLPNVTRLSLRPQNNISESSPLKRLNLGQINFIEVVGSTIDESCFGNCEAPQLKSVSLLTVKVKQGGLDPLLSFSKLSDIFLLRTPLLENEIENFKRRGIHVHIQDRP